ncbi:MAG: hypothetical protein IJ735_06500 [Clostridia bacterium]|nr:hypothetical protein [Clostridia bacterium]
MRGRDIGRKIALAGVGAAISLVFVVLAYFVRTLTISFAVLSAVGIMLPLSKGYYKEGLLSAVAVTAGGFFIVGLSIVPFAAASGFYVVFSIFWYEKDKNRLLGYGIKFVYSCLLFFVLYQVIGLLSVDLEKITFLDALPDAALYILFNGVFSICFLLYDFLLEKVFVYLGKLVKRIVK